MQSLESNVGLSPRLFTTSRLSLTSEPVWLMIQSLEYNVDLSPRLFTTSLLTLTSETVWQKIQSLESNVDLSLLEYSRPRGWPWPLSLNWLRPQSLEYNVDHSPRLFTTSLLTLTSKPVLANRVWNILLTSLLVLFTTSRMTLTSEPDSAKATESGI